MTVSSRPRPRVKTQKYSVFGYRFKLPQGAASFIPSSRSASDRSMDIRAGLRPTLDEWPLPREVDARSRPAMAVRSGSRFPVSIARGTYERAGRTARSIYRRHAGWTMFKASMHPVILCGEFHYLGLEKRIHATRII